MNKRIAKKILSYRPKLNHTKKQIATALKKLGLQGE